MTDPNVTNAAYDPERYWDEKAKAAPDASAAVRLGDPALDRCIARSQQALIESALRQLQTRSAVLTDMTVLDFGCGTGQWTQLLQQRFDGYAGVDISNEMLESARASFPVERNPNIEFKQVREHGIPFEDHTFDVAFSMAVLHHNPYEEQAILLDELCRVLRNGGWLFAFEGVGERNTDVNSHSYYRPIEDWKAFYQQHDLQVVWKSNCRYALLWYLCERMAARLRPKGSRNSRTLLGQAMRRFILRIDGWLSPTVLPWTPDRLAGRCAMLLRRTK